MPDTDSLVIRLVPDATHAPSAITIAARTIADHLGTPGNQLTDYERAYLDLLGRMISLRLRGTAAHV